VSAREKPWAIEAFVARNLRRLAIPRAARQNTNPLPLTPEILAGGRAHFADHCASCHANDGSAVTPMGPNFYPPVPDMRLAETQSLSDGELFYLIENGIRFTGMPAWGTDSPEDDRDTWALVHFIRHLSNLTPEELLEMKALNPRSRRELEEELEIERFLEGEDVNRSSSEHKH
jgi:mono/diheme cytochrome c family protein